jgi:hypothetical protein
VTAEFVEPAQQALAQFIHHEREVREAATSQALAYCLVNRSQGLLNYRHAALLIGGRVRAVTGVTAPDPNAPFVAFVEAACQQLLTQGKLQQIEPVQAGWLSSQLQQDWQSLSALEVLWLPLRDRKATLIGGIWLARAACWQPADGVLAQELAALYSHAWCALEPQPRRWHVGRLRRRYMAAAGVALLVLCLPVQQSVLAPAEVVPRDGRVVAAPLDGVIAEFLVKPNQVVQRGQKLVRFDVTTLKAQADVAQRALEVAQAEHRASSQRAFQDAESNAQLDLLVAQVAQKRAERDYAQDLLQRGDVLAERDGIAVFADAERWVGKPVRTGEALMTLADPAQAELKIELDSGDAVTLPPAAEVALFLDSDPLHRHQARLTRAAYTAELTANGNLAYRLDATFVGQAPRIGLRGTAKVFAERVPLAIYLFRRPLAALRKTFGV